MNQQAIAELPGLGPMSAAMLAGVGITSVAQLKRLGSGFVIHQTSSGNGVFYTGFAR
ncbi:MAG: hypothetical protein EBX66_05070 [Betaproteobacteria bacterium]|nr:hypothetical protein [Betaproteobacteria bacterium]